MEEKTKGQLLADKLIYKNKPSYETKNADKAAVNEYCEGYRNYLNNSKTEREAVRETIRIISEYGYVPYKLGDKLERGGKYYYSNRGKSLFMFRIGTEDIEKGIRITASHIDSPRIDFKPQPVFEDSGLCYFKTHYYGGIKKFQWVAIPLALHGVICTDNGEVDVCVGEDDSEPVFYITDCPPHLGKNQRTQSMGDGITGEQLNIVAGCEPYDDEKLNERIKLNLLALLHEKYGCTEEDLIRSELCAVPALKARDIGFDRGMMGAYGHDDKVCAYPSITAMLESEDSEHTLLNIIADKEETGSDGVSGMQCRLFVDLMDEISIALGGNPRVVRSNSMCLSADVNVAYDPNFPECFEKRNTAFCGHGVVFSKYTGVAGKASTSDASAEYVAYLTRLFNENCIDWQLCELGKVDFGGGGTVAKYIANQNIDTIDLGVPVMSMHGTYEMVAKNDIYMLHKAIRAFYK